MGQWLQDHWFQILGLLLGLLIFVRLGVLGIRLNRLYLTLADIHRELDGLAQDVRHIEQRTFRHFPTEKERSVSADIAAAEWSENRGER